MTTAAIQLYTNGPYLEATLSTDITLPSGIPVYVLATGPTGASPLPAGAATSANQTTEIASLATIATNSGTQATAANQTAVIGSAGAGTAAASSELTGGVYNSTLPTLTSGQQAAIQIDVNGRQLVTRQALAPVATTVAASSLVLKANAGNLLSLTVCAGATGGYIMLFDATSAPADGTVTPKWAYPVYANGAFNQVWTNALLFTTGVTAVFSSTGPFAKTASATAFIEGQVQ